MRTGKQFTRYVLSYAEHAAPASVSVIAVPSALDCGEGIFRVAQGMVEEEEEAY